VLPLPGLSNWPPNFLSRPALYGFSITLLCDRNHIAAAPHLLRMIYLVLEKVEAGVSIIPLIRFIQPSPRFLQHVEI